MKEKTGRPLRVGVVVAIEIDAVLERYGAPLEEIREQGQHVRLYRRGGALLYVLEAGAGEIAAAAATAWLIARFGVELIVNFGVVGALSEEMATAELGIVESVVHYDFDSTGWLDLPRGRYPDQPAVLLETTPSLLALSEAALPGVRRVVCASADKFVDSAEAKSALRREFGADICDMEAAGITLTCRRMGVPCLLLKAVSDALTGGGAEFARELGRVSRVCFEGLEKVIAALA